MVPGSQRTWWEELGSTLGRGGKGWGAGMPPLVFVLRNRPVLCRTMLGRPQIPVGPVRKQRELACSGTTYFNTS